MNGYAPVSCAAYDELEIAIMRRQRLNARWRAEDGAEHAETIIPLDLSARDGVEWLKARSAAGTELVLRLDWLELVSPG